MIKPIKSLPQTTQGCICVVTNATDVWLKKSNLHNATTQIKTIKTLRETNSGPKTTPQQLKMVVQVTSNTRRGWIVEVWKYFIKKILEKFDFKIIFKINKEKVSWIKKYMETQRIEND